MAGDLRERLPTRKSNDPFDQLAASVNLMLGEIEALVHEIAGVGNDIAHDLRTPLTRVRARLERGRERAKTLEELRTVADQSIAGLDQSLAVVTALLRIAEIEHSRRLEGFSQVQLAPLLREVGDLYEPIAEDKHVALQVETADAATVHGDRDLLFEAVANLVDNAVKFTPPGRTRGTVLLRRDGESVIQVNDTGPGIPEAEREAVIKRFYRSDKSRCTEGLGPRPELGRRDRQIARLPLHDCGRAGLHGGDRIPVDIEPHLPWPISAIASQRIALSTGR